jgi:hypothetical protein
VPKFIVDVDDLDEDTCDFMYLMDNLRGVKAKPVTPEILEAVEEVCGQYEDVNGGDCAKTVREFFDA